jgi:UV DNA damage repair endonuclease
MWFYFQSDVVDYFEKHLSKVGDIARGKDVRLSFHPGQFCVLASENDGIVDNSIVEFEYHTGNFKILNAMFILEANAVRKGLLQQLES